MSAGIRAGSSNDGYVQVNGNDIITALSGGNVGIGNTSPSTKLHVNGTVTATAFAGALTGTSSGNPTLTNGANNRIVTATGANALTGETNLQWDGETFYINRSSNTVEGLSISNSNNSQGSAGAQLNLSGGDNSYANIRLECNGTSHHIRQDGSGNLKFYNNTTDRVHITSAGKLSVKSAAENTVCISLLDNNSSNEIWRVGQAADGDGYMQCLADEGSANVHLDASGNSYVNGGYFGVGKSSPGCALDVLDDSQQTVARFLCDHNTLGGGVQVKNNNQRGAVEFLYKDGSNQGALFHSTGGWTWDKELQLVGTAKLRIGTTNNYGDSGLTVDTDTVTNGAHIAQFKGRTVGNGAGLGFVHLTCGSDDDRTGLQWEHQNVSNERMWFGDDKRLYLKNSNPTESTAQGRYIMTVAAGVPDYPDGQSYDNAAKSALEIKKHYPNSQNGNYWIFDHNNVPRQIFCDMEVDGGGWMMWHDYNSTRTSMNEALGGSATSPSSGLGRGNYGNYARYQVLIRASKVGDPDREALHTIVQLDHNGNLFRKYDYGEEFLKEEVGNPYTPEYRDYFRSADGEWIMNDMAYGGQCGSNNAGWTSFGTGWSYICIREVDSRLSPGDHRSYAMHERVFCFNDNGVPMWRNADSTGILPYWTDIRGQDNMADGAGLNSSGTTTDNMHDTGRTLYMNNGNNGDALHGRIHGVFLGEFEVAFRLSAWWGWAVGNMNAGIGVQESISDGQAWPYYLNTNYGYAGFGLMNNSSNNLWYPNHFYNGDTSQTIGNSGSGWSGGNSGWNIMWRTGDGTIKVRRQDNTHGTYTYGKFVGPLIFGNGYQSPAFTEMGVCWDKPWNTNGSCMR